MDEGVGDVVDGGRDRWAMASDLPESAPPSRTERESKRAAKAERGLTAGPGPSHQHEHAHAGGSSHGATATSSHHPHHMHPSGGGSSRREKEKRENRDREREHRERERARSSSDCSNDTLGANNFDELRMLEQGRHFGEFDWWGLSSKRDWVRIGKGGYGSVYKAKWYGKTVAVKEARANSKGSAKRALEREVDHLSKLHHPNGIHVFGCFQRKNSMYLVMEVRQTE